jgi:hypothetical protein
MSELLAALDPAKRWALATNRDYELQIRAGGGATAIINKVGNRTPGTYSLETGFSGKSKIGTTDDTFELDQFDDDVLLIDSIEDAQQKRSLRRVAIGRVVEGLAIAENAYIAQTMYDGGTDLDPDNGGAASAGSPRSLDAADTKEGVLELLYDLHSQLVATNADISPDNTFVYVDAATQSQLQRNDVFRSAMNSGSSATLRRGVLGEFLNMSIVLSNVQPTPSEGTAHVIVLAHQSATTYAERVWPLKPVDSTEFYGVEIQVVHQYGAKVLRPTLVVLGHWEPSGS